MANRFMGISLGRSRTERLLNIFAALAILAIPAWILFTVWISQPIPFNANLWQQAPNNPSLRNVRYRMISDLESKLERMKPISFKEVRELLGSDASGDQKRISDGQEPKYHKLRYYIGGIKGLGLVPSQGWVLDLYFDENKQLLKFLVVPE